MKCARVELYISAMLDNELSLKDSIEAIEHIERCSACKAKWELNEETRAKLQYYISFVDVSNNLQHKINKTLGLSKQQYYFKPLIIAACTILILGLGLFVNDVFIQIPHLYKIHNNIDFQLISNDIELLSNHAGANLQKQHLSNFELAMFTPHGAVNFKRPFNKNYGLIALKNDKGQRISLCFLPKDYKSTLQSNKHEINGITVHHGQDKNYHFAYWQQNDKTIALISDSLTPVEMINLAGPLIYERRYTNENYEGV